MTAVVTLVEDAAYKAKVLGQDQAMSSGDAQLILRILNRMLASWANERMLIFGITDEVFTMTASQSDYSTTLFPEGRPTAILSMYVTLNNINYPVDMIDVQKWNAIAYKLTESIPNQCYYNPSFPDGALHFYPKPYAAFTCTANCQYPLSGDVSLTTDLLLPEGYEQAIVDNLAVMIWPYFKDGQPSGQMAKEAMDSKAVIKRNFTTVLEMETPFGNPTGDISNAFLYKGF